MGDDIDIDADALADVAMGGGGEQGGPVAMDPAAEASEASATATAPGPDGPLRSLFFAPERGPSQLAFVEVGVDEDPALILDGATDWVLDVVGGDAADELDDSLGPAGKMALGAGRMLSTSGSGDDAGDDDRGDDQGDESVDDLSAVVDQ